MNIDFNYIEEDKHIGNQEYFKTKIEYNNINKNLIKFETKRNLRFLLTSKCWDKNAHFEIYI